MDTNLTLISRKYAIAFVNLFGKKLSTEDIKSIKLFEKYFTTHPNVSFYLQLNSISDDTKKDFLKKLRENYNLIKEFDNLINLLLKDKRIILLTTILPIIVEIYETKSNTLEFIFSSASDLTTDQCKAFQKFLERKTGKKIIYKIYKDKSLIAGVKLHSDDLLWEYSIKNQLQNVKYF